MFGPPCALAAYTPWECVKEGAEGMTTVTMTMPSCLSQAELRSVLTKKRGDDADDDSGLPRSPATPPGGPLHAGKVRRQTTRTTARDWCPYVLLFTLFLCKKSLRLPECYNFALLISAENNSFVVMTFSWTAT